MTRLISLDLKTYVIPVDYDVNSGIISNPSGLKTIGGLLWNRTTGDEIRFAEVILEDCKGWGTVGLFNPANTLVKIHPQEWEYPMYCLMYTKENSEVIYYD